ncbi:MAG: DUF2194 domain-containing protein, partial [Spirochaetota bacterium]
VTTNFAKEKTYNFFCSGNYALQLARSADPSSDKGYYATYMFYVPASKEYDFWMGCTPPGSRYSQNVGYASPFEWKIDDCPYKTASSENTYVKNFYANGGFYWTKISSGTLNAGKHTLTLRVNQKRSSGWDYYFYVDTIMFIPTHSDYLVPMMPFPDEAPKDFYLAEDALSVKMGKKVLRNGWELGFHGFNHMSLTTTRPEHYDSTPWKDREAMEAALRLSRDEWISLYGEAMLPVSYVAPHNIIDDAGLRAIGNVFPEIRVVATLYTSREGERTQEFTWTPDNRFFQIPRITSGYYLQNYNRYAMYDALHNMGIVSHFIHPDDVFDESRSKEFSGWQWLKKQFIAEFDMLKKNIPWLRWMTVKDAYREMEFYTTTDIQVEHGDQSIKIFSSDGSENDLYFRVSLPAGKKVTRIKNCNIVFRNIKTGDLVVKTDEPVAGIWYR